MKDESSQPFFGDLMHDELSRKGRARLKHRAAKGKVYKKRHRDKIASSSLKTRRASAA